MKDEHCRIQDYRKDFNHHAAYYQRQANLLQINSNKKRDRKQSLFLYPRAESNRHPKNRNLIFYPLNYRGITLNGGQS